MLVNSKHISSNIFEKRKGTRIIFVIRLFHVDHRININVNLNLQNLCQNIENCVRFITRKTFATQTWYLLYILILNKCPKHQRLKIQFMSSVRVFQNIRLVQLTVCPLLVYLVFLGTSMEGIVLLKGVESEQNTIMECNTNKWNKTIF